MSCGRSQFNMSALFRGAPNQCHSAGQNNSPEKMLGVIVGLMSALAQKGQHTQRGQNQCQSDGQNSGPHKEFQSGVRDGQQLVQSLFNGGNQNSGSPCHALNAGIPSNGCQDQMNSGDQNATFEAFTFVLNSNGGSTSTGCQ